MSLAPSRRRQHARSFASPASLWPTLEQQVPRSTRPQDTGARSETGPDLLDDDDGDHQHHHQLELVVI